MKADKPKVRGNIQNCSIYFPQCFASHLYINDDNKTLPAPTPIQHEEFAHIDITEQDAIDVLRKLKVTKECGPDLISPHLLKEGALCRIQAT